MASSIKTKYVYDVEVYPNFFCATFINVDTGGSGVFTVFNEIDQREELAYFLDRNIELIGFNNISYDGPVLYYLISRTENMNVREANAALFEISGRLIDDRSRSDDEIRKLRWARGIKYHQTDLMKIMNFDGLGVSLKQVAISLKWPRIQDLPLPYDTMIQPEQVELIQQYNMNDAGITLALYNAIQPQIKLRQDLSVFYGVDLTSSSDSNMANKILEHIYAKETNVDLAAIKDLRTHRNEIKVSDCIGRAIEFKSPKLQALLADLKGMTLKIDNKFEFSKLVRVGGTVYDLGVGGIHSQDKAEKFVADPAYAIRDADVASYYPNIMLVNKLAPAHLDQSDFTRILGKITAERIAAKKAGDKAKADGLKITINSIFGKLGSDTFWLMDQLAFLSVTISGQLYLLMLIEALELAGIEVISANTDGIVAKIPADLDDKYYEITDWWQARTGFDLEFSDYSLYVRLDVNNYLTVKKKGEIKTKGRLVFDLGLQKGYKHPIVPQAVYEYFVNGTPIDETFAKATDILDFCISQKTGGDFRLEYRTLTSTEVLQKTNRFFITNKRGGALVKVRQSNGKEIGCYVGNAVQILNDLDVKQPISAYNLDLDFYRYEARNIIEAIEPVVVQMGLFG